MCTFIYLVARRDATKVYKPMIDKHGSYMCLTAYTSRTQAIYAIQVNYLCLQRYKQYTCDCVFAQPGHYIGRGDA